LPWGILSFPVVLSSWFVLYFKTLFRIMIQLTKKQGVLSRKNVIKNVIKKYLDKGVSFFLFYME